MRVSILILPLIAASALADCDETGRRETNIPAAGVTRLNIEAGAGELKVLGVPGSDSIRARGTACASSRRLLEQIKITSQRNGNTATLKAVMPDMDGWFPGKTARLDLEIEVPATISVRIDDSSGDVEAGGLASLSIEDGSGSLEIRNIRGSVEIEDGSGDLAVEEIGGDLTIDDGSGSIEVRKVVGNVKVEDGSGGIRIREVRQNVTIDDSSGGIDVADVGGDFTVRDDSSGGVSVSEVRGKVSVPRD